MLRCNTMGARTFAASGSGWLTATSLLLALGLLGCSGESSPAAVAEESAPCASDARACTSSEPSVTPSASNPPAATSVGETQPATTNGGATYTVPVPDALAPFATFDLDEVRLDEKGGELELSYDLPALLVGEERRIALRGVAQSGVYELSGDVGRASCREQDGMWRCDEALMNLVIDTDKLEQELERFPEAEAAPRRDVAERFAVDPIGVLRFAQLQ
jgi:hypothetical protein